MKIASAVVLAALFFAAAPSHAGWMNKWDKPLAFECPKGSSISRIKSEHSNRKEDRRWEFWCKKDPFMHGWCTDSGTVNSMDKPLHFECYYAAANPGVIVAAYSQHSNIKEDRKWQFKCCFVPTRFRKCYSGCRYTGYVNEYDGEMDYRVPGGYVLVGAKSEHDSHHEDRRWEFRICKIVDC